MNLKLTQEGMVEFIGLVKVKVVKGTNLAIRDMLSSDPYVVLQLGQQVSCSRFYLDLRFLNETSGFCIYMRDPCPHKNLIHEGECSKVFSCKPAHSDPHSVI